MGEDDPGRCIGGGGPPLLRTEVRTHEGRSGVCPICSQRLPLDERGRLPDHVLPDDDVERRGSY
ncbi:MAG TPA: hypothetical protein VFB42_01165 [Gaiellaceae bacterium]|nr:hypothetical protein [Gaiellaceae bacterium]